MIYKLRLIGGPKSGETPIVCRDMCEGDIFECVLYGYRGHLCTWHSRYFCNGDGTATFLCNYRYSESYLFGEPE